MPGPIDRGAGGVGGGDAKRTGVDRSAPATQQPSTGAPGAVSGVSRPATAREVERIRNEQRVASQAGFVRDKATEAAFNLGDYARAPIPLDPADVDPKQWSARALRSVTDHLTLKTAKFAEIRKSLDSDASSWSHALVAGLLGRADRALQRWGRRRGGAVVDDALDGGGAAGGPAADPAFETTTPDAAAAASVSQADAGAEEFVATAPETGGAAAMGAAPLPPGGGAQIDTQDLRGHLERLFGLVCEADQSDLGRTVVTAGLVVAGRAGDLAGVESGAARDQALAGALCVALEEGKQAVQEFEQMHSKIDRQVNVHRTFLFKR